MIMTLFDSVKDTVTTRQAAERYGIHVGHSGMCRCPFHNDRNPSMKVDKRYHCFSCQADGDVISFTARLFNLSPKEAALRLAADFGISYDARDPMPVKAKHREISEAEILKHQVNYCYSQLTDYRHKLVRWQEQYAPKTPEEDFHPLYLEAVRYLPQVEDQLDVLLYGSDAEKLEVLNEYNLKNKEVRYMEPVVKTPVYRETAAYARENGELEQFRNSHWTNIACKNEIEDAIARHFDGMHLAKEAVTEVLDRFGSDRVALVLAATVQVKAWDGRFSMNNKDWAFSVAVPTEQSARGFDRRDEYAVASHPAVLDGYIRLARQEMRDREKTSIREALHQPVSSAAKPAVKKDNLER